MKKVETIIEITFQELENETACCFVNQKTDDKAKLEMGIASLLQYISDENMEDILENSKKLVEGRKN